MSNPYGWSQPTDGQPAVYFAPPGENVVVSASAAILWLKNWNNFSGRASRSEYWGVRIVQLVVQVPWLVFFIGVLQTSALSPTDDVMKLLVTVMLLVTCVAMLVLSVPTLSLTVRRLHDTDHSGWYFLIQYVPFGSWLLFRALRQASDPAGFRFDDSTSRPYGIEDID